MNSKDIAEEFKQYFNKLLNNNEPEIAQGSSQEEEEKNHNAQH